MFAFACRIHYNSDLQTNSYDYNLNMVVRI